MDFVTAIGGGSSATVFSTMRLRSDVRYTTRFLFDFVYFLKRTRKGIEVGRWLCIDGFSRGLGMPRAPCGAPVKAVQRGLSIILMQFMEAARLKFGARGRGAHQTALASAPISALSLVINTGPRALPTPGISAIPCKSPALTLNGFLQDYCHQAVVPP